MSVEKLQKAIQRLPARRATAEDVAALKSAAGRNVNGDEAALLKALLDQDADRFTRDGRAALVELAGEPSTKIRAARFELKARHTLDLKEASGLTFLGPRAGFVVVSDRETSLTQLRVRGGDVETAALKASGGELRGLEGVAFDAEAGRLLVLSEDKGTVTEMAVEIDGGDVSLMKGKVLGALPDISRSANKGWEGLTVLPAKLSEDRKPHLIAVHEGSPRTLAVLDRKSLDCEQQLKLPDELKDALEDLSGVAVDPKTGHLFLLSDESEAIFEVALRCRQKPGPGGRPQGRWELEPLGVTKLPVQAGAGRLQPEGIAFDGQGDLWVVAEGKKGLLHLERQA